jgi:hypothetical protein
MAQNDLSCREYYEGALERAVSYDEIYAVLHPLALIDTQNVILNEYPTVMD